MPEALRYHIRIKKAESKANNSIIQPDFRIILWFAKYVRPRLVSTGSHVVKGENQIIEKRQETGHLMEDYQLLVLNYYKQNSIHWNDKRFT